MTTLLIVLTPIVVGVLLVALLAVLLRMTAVLNRIAETLSATAASAHSSEQRLRLRQPIRSLNDELARAVVALRPGSAAARHRRTEP